MREEIKLELLTVARKLSPEELPRFFGDISEIRRIAELCAARTVQHVSVGDFCAEKCATTGAAGRRRLDTFEIPEDKHRRFLTPAEAAHFLGGLNARTVVRWAREGYLPAIPIGEGKRRLWRFVANDLEQWMLSRRNGTLVPAADAPTGGF